jgi:hypothetical protein
MGLDSSDCACSSTMTPSATMDDDRRVVDEQTALLAPQSKNQRQPTPLPWLQISIVLLLQVCEPITSQSIYPYINQVLLSNERLLYRLRSPIFISL